MRKALVFYSYSISNPGDLAICIGTAALLNDCGFEVTFVSKYTKSNEEYIESVKYFNIYLPDIRILPGLLDYDRKIGRMGKIINYVKGMFKLLSSNIGTEMNNEIKNTDLVFFAGGNSYRGQSFRDYARLLGLCYPCKTINKLNKPIIVLPQSTSTIRLPAKMLLNHNFHDSKVFFVREALSYEYYKKTLKTLKFAETIDTAFFVTDNQLALDEYKRKYSSIQKSNRKKVAITIRTTEIGDRDFFSETKGKAIIEQIKKFILSINNNFDVFLVVQTLIDLSPTQELFSKVKAAGVDNVSCIFEEDAYLLRELYRNMDLLVAMRLHSAILALTVNTPVYGFFDNSWGFKGRGVLERFKMPYCTTEEELAEKIRNSIDSYIDMDMDYVQEIIKTESRLIKDIISTEKEKIG
jgi:polysaccharide pyruvyl transferase WcaK-like protein